MPGRGQGGRPGALTTSPVRTAAHHAPAPHFTAPFTPAHPHPKESTPIDTTSLFSEPEPVVSYTETASGPPTIKPFQAPDFPDAPAEESDHLDRDPNQDDQLRTPFAPSA